MTRRLLVLLFVVGALPAGAQEFPAWYVQGAVGGAAIHGNAGLSDPDSGSFWLGARVGRAFGERGIFAFDAGVGIGSSDGGFTTYTGGLELRAFARSRVSPFVRLEMGYMTEDLGPCLVGGLGVGVSVRATHSVSLRASVMSGAHCSDGQGPESASAGVEFRW